MSRQGSLSFDAIWDMVRYGIYTIVTTNYGIYTTVTTDYGIYTIVTTNYGIFSIVTTVLVVDRVTGWRIDFWPIYIINF